MALCDDFFTNTVACYAWLMVSSRNVWIAGAMLEGVLLRLGQFATEKCQSQKESVYEIYCAVMQNRSRTSSCDTGMLHDVIERALSEFPDNAALLSMQAQLQNTMRQLSRLTASAKINYTALGHSMRILSLEFRSMTNEAGENETTTVNYSFQPQSYFKVAKFLKALFNCGLIILGGGDQKRAKGCVTVRTGAVKL